MSYTTVNGMRSTRFPLSGDCGCGCKGAGTCKPRLGEDASAAEQAIQGAGAGGLLLLLGFGALLLAGASPSRR